MAAGFSASRLAHDALGNHRMGVADRGARPVSLLAGVGRMTTKLDDISEAIGSLRAEVAGLRRDFQTSELRAVDHRSGVHRRMDNLVSEVSGVKVELAVVKEDVTDVKGDIADMKPVTDDVRRWKLMGIGALGVTGIAAAAIASIVTAYWSKIVTRSSAHDPRSVIPSQRRVRTHSFFLIVDRICANSGHPGKIG
jgi:hypothetical protein